MTRSTTCFLLLALLGCAACAQAQLAAGWSSAERAGTAPAALAALKGELTASDAAAAAELLSISGATAQGKSSCGAISALAGKASNVVDVADVAEALATLSCGGSLPGSAAAVLKAAAEDSEADMGTLYAAVRGAAAGKVSINWAAAVEAAVELLEVDGSFRPSAEEEPTALATGQAYHLLAAAFSHVSDDEESGERIDAALENVASFFGTADGKDDSSLQFGEGGNRLQATALVVSGALALGEASGEELDISADQLAGLSAFLVENTGVADLRTRGHVLSALSAVAAAAEAPLVVAVATPSVPETGAAAVSIAVTDVMGAAVKDAKLQLLSATARGSEEAAVENVALKAVSGKPGQYSFALPATRAPGFYSAELTVNGGLDVTRSFKVSTQASVSSVDVVVSTSLNREASGKSKTTVKAGGSLRSAVTVGDKEHAHFLFWVTSASGAKLQPHFAAVRFTNGAHVVTLPARYDAKVDGMRLSIDFGAAATAAAFSHASGNWEATLLVGDAFITTALSWKLGKLDISLPQPAKQADPPLYTRHLLYESDTTLKALPTITHAARQPESRPPKVVSTAFTAAVIAPLALLLISFASAGVNLRRMNGLVHILFLAALGAMLALLAAYWLYLNMFELLRLLVPLAAVTAFLGNRALAALAADRVKED